MAIESKKNFTIFTLCIATRAIMEAGRIRKVEVGVVTELYGTNKNYDLVKEQVVPAMVFKGV